MEDRLKGREADKKHWTGLGAEHSAGIIFAEYMLHWVSQSAFHNWNSREKLVGKGAAINGSQDGGSQVHIRDSTSPTSGGDT